MDKINIEVAYATPKKQLILNLSIPINTSIIEAIKLSNISDHFKELQNTPLDNTIQLGIFGKKIDPIKYQLQPHDRIEIYRPLTKTPNQRRLERAKT